MPREINAAGYRLIKEFEGLRLRAYLCPADVWTIGYGHTDGVREGQTITEKQADSLLDKDLDWAEGCVEQFAPVTNDNEFAAMVSLVFNIGATNFKKSTVLRLHNAGDTLGAARAFRMWNKAKVGGQLQELPGLTRRRLAEEALYLTPASVFQEQAMPQAVAPEKSAATSKTILTTAAAGVSVTGIIAENIQPAIDAVKGAADAAQQATTAWGAVKDALGVFGNGHVFTVALLAVALAALVYVGWRYFAKVRRGEAVPS